MIHARQKEYYRTLAACDKAGESTAFIEFCLTTIRETLEERWRASTVRLLVAARIALVKSSADTG